MQLMKSSSAQFLVSRFGRMAGFALAHSTLEARSEWRPRADEAQQIHLEEQKTRSAKKRAMKRGPASALSGHEGKGFAVLASAKAGLNRAAAEAAAVHVAMARPLRQVALDVRTSEVCPGKKLALSAVALVRGRQRFLLRYRIPACMHAAARTCLDGVR